MLTPHPGPDENGPVRVFSRDTTITRESAKGRSWRWAEGVTPVLMYIPLLGMEGHVEVY